MINYNIYPNSEKIQSMSRQVQLLKTASSFKSKCVKLPALTVSKVSIISRPANITKPQNLISDIALPPIQPRSIKSKIRSMQNKNKTTNKWKTTSKTFSLLFELNTSRRTEIQSYTLSELIGAIESIQSLEITEIAELKNQLLFSTKSKNKNELNEAIRLIDLVSKKFNFISLNSRVGSLFNNNINFLIQILNCDSKKLSDRMMDKYRANKNTTQAQLLFCQKLIDLAFNN